jgi:hypothetical protein
MTEDADARQVESPGQLARWVRHIQQRRPIERECDI